MHSCALRSLRRPWVRGDVALIGGPHMLIVKRNNTPMGLNDGDVVVARLSEKEMTNVIDKLHR